MDIKIRPATIDDSKAILAWRNDPHTRAMSIESDIIDFVQHHPWYLKSLDNENRHFLIGEIDGNSIGMCRFDYDGNQSTISINLNPQFRGQGLASDFLNQSIVYYSAINSVPLLATIKKDNIPSIRCFEKNGFEYYDGDETYNYYLRGIDS